MEVEQALELKKELTQGWREAHAVMSDVDAYYEDTFPVKVEKGFEVHRTGEGRRIINWAGHNVVVENEVITVPPREGTQKADAQADRLEHFYTAEIQWEDKQHEEAVLKMLAKAAVLYGLGVRKGPLWNEEALLKPIRGEGETRAGFRERITHWEKHRKGIFPLKDAILDPRTIFYPVEVFPPPVVLEICQKPREYIEKRYNIALPGSAKEIEWLEAWDTESRVFLADGHPVLLEGGEVNVGGFIPYTFVFSGLGLRALDSSGALNPARITQGMLHGVRGQISALTRICSALEAMVLLYGFRRPVVEGDASKIDWGTGPGSSISIPEGVKVTWPEIPPVITDVWNFINLMLRRIEESTISRVLAGIRIPGGSSGYMEALERAQAVKGFTPLLRNLERAREVYLGNVGRLIESLDEVVTIRATLPEGYQELTLDARDWDGHYEVFSLLSGVSPEEADRKAELGRLLQGSGIISHQTNLERYAMLPDATRERERILVEKILAHPLVEQLLAQKALERWGGEELANKITELARQPVGAPPTPTSLTPTPPQTPVRPPPPGSPEELRMYLDRVRNLRGRGGIGQFGQEGQLTGIAEGTR